MNLTRFWSFAAALSLGAAAWAVPLADDFETDTSANYTGSNSYGAGGSFDVAGGTLKLTPASGNTHAIVHTTSNLEVGDSYAIDALDPWSGSGNSGGGDGQFLMLTTGSGQPDGSTSFGFRLRVDNNAVIRLSTYSNGGSTTIDTSTPTSVAPDTFWIDRTSATDFEFYHGPAGSRTLVTTGSLQASEVTGPVRVGVQAYSAGGSEEFNFDYLRVGLPTWPSITGFSVSDELLVDPGAVTFTWSTHNAASATLNGLDVTGQSPLTLPVSAAGDYVLEILGTDGSTTSQTIRIRFREGFSIAAVADPQYADAPPRGGREPGEGVSRLTHAVNEWNQRSVDWGVMLGDLIDWDDIDYAQFPGSTVTNAPQDWSNADAILGAWDLLDVPKYLVLGNHDYYVPHHDVDGLAKPHSVYRQFGFKDKAYYAFRHKGFRFIVMEGDNSHLNYAEGTPEYVTAKAYFDAFTGPQGAVWWNAGVLDPQLIWLMEQLDVSQTLGEPVVVLCHYPIHTPVGNHSMYNSDELRAILDGYRDVVLWLNGHNHGGGYALHGWRHHVNLKGMQNEGDNWYELVFMPDRVVAYQAENTTTPVYDLDIARPQTLVDTPTGFAVAGAAGSASLTWDAEPAGVTGVVIETRHVPSTEPWQVLTTLVASVGTYLHAPSNPLAEYSYRIRFEAGAAGSRYAPALGVGETAGMSYAQFADGLGPEAQAPGGDADTDGKTNVLEHFYGTPVEEADVAPDREVRITQSPSGKVQLTFSHVANTVHAWDLFVSTDLKKTWRSRSRDLDYRIVDRHDWTPTGDPTVLTRVTVELMGETSFALAETGARLYARLVITPAAD